MTSWIKGGKGINRSFVQAIYQTLKIMAPNVSFRPIPIHNTLLHYNVNHNKIIWYYLCQKLTNQSCFDLNLIEFKHFLSFEVFVGFLKPKVWFLSLFQNHYYMIFGNLIKEKIMTSSLRFKPFISIADFRLLRQKKNSSWSSQIHTTSTSHTSLSFWPLESWNGIDLSSKWLLNFEQLLTSLVLEELSLVVWLFWPLLCIQSTASGLVSP